MDDLGSAVAVRKVVARRGNHLSGAQGEEPAREFVWYYAIAILPLS